MSRMDVRWAVLGALAACGATPAESKPPPVVPDPVPSAAPLPPVGPVATPGQPAGSLIPELDNPPGDPVPRPDGPMPDDRVARYASAELFGNFVPNSGGALNLAVQADREQAVRACLDAQTDPTACDMRTWKPMAEWVALSPSGISTHAWLGPDLKWRSTGIQCSIPVSGPCYQQTVVDARTGICVPDGPPACRRGRPFDDRVAALEGEARSAAAAAWARIALDEHASIAAFARHTLELMSLGAPLELVEAATRAQADEVQHAMLALGLARRFGATDLAFGALDTSVPARTSLADVLFAVAQEGCVGETLAAVEAAAALEQTDDAEIERVLTQIVADETRHAALAWRTLAWGLPKLAATDRERVLAALADRSRVGPSSPVPHGIGVLGGSASAEALAWGFEHVVRPAAAALA